MKGGVRAPPTLTSQANFTLMTECTPESRRYYSVYSVVYAVHFVWYGGGVVREKIEGQKYTSVVPSSMGGNSSQAGMKIPTMSECISNL
jgi:hypothetical protein